MNIFEAIVLGIVSGIITSLITFVFLQYWSHVLVPWFENRVYKGIRINGKWQITVESEIPYEAEAEVIQSAHKVSGIISSREKGKQLFQYQFEGEFKNLILTTVFWQKDSDSLDRGTFTMICTKNGKLLRGKYSWYNESTGDVTSGAYEWQRAP